MYQCRVKINGVLCNLIVWKMNGSRRAGGQYDGGCRHGLGSIFLGSCLLHVKVFFLSTCGIGLSFRMLCAGVRSREG